MDERSELRPDRRHSVRIYNEKVWPFQWIGMCSCHVGIRCNDETQAREFMADCLKVSLR